MTLRFLVSWLVDCTDFFLIKATGRRGDEPEKSLLPEPDHLEAVDSSFRAVLTVNTYWSEGNLLSRQGRPQDLSATVSKLISTKN